MNEFRYYLSYLVAKAYQFVSTFPDFYNNQISVPTNYELMSWWDITDFLCLLSNKLYPDKLAKGEISGAMVKASLDKMPEEIRESMWKQLKEIQKEDLKEEKTNEN